MDKEKTGKVKKRIARSAVALTTAASLITAGLFHTPAEIVKEEDVLVPPAIVETMDREPVPDEPEDMPEEEEERKKSLKDRFREILLHMPRIVRVLLLLPLWCIGTALMAVLTPLFQAVLPPLLNIVLVVIYSAVVGMAGWVLEDLYPETKLLVPAVYAGAAALFTGGVLISAMFSRREKKPESAS